MLRQRLRTASSILALVAALSFATPSCAADASVAAAEMNGYGRLVFSLNKNVKAQIRASSGVIVLSFDEPVNVDLEKLAAQMPAYVSVARRDPDGRTVRFATTRPLRTNLMEAGEKLFLDLLPENWQGLPPSLPQDVVEQLAKRARDAEEQLRKTQREREKRELRDMTARVGNGPTFTRLIFDIGQTVPVDITRDGDQLTMKFDAALRFDTATIKPQLPAGVQTIEAETKGGMLTLTIAVAAKTEMRAFREDDTVIVDFPRARDPGRESDVVLPALTKPAEGKSAEGKSAEGKSAAAQPAAATAEVTKAQRPPARSRKGP